MFPLIASKPPSVPAYISALNPSDQIFDFEELEYYYLVANRKPEENEDVDSDADEKRDTEELSQSPPKKRKNKKSGEFKKEPDSHATTRSVTPVEQKPLPPPPPEPEKIIDNPFLKLKKTTT